MQYHFFPRSHWGGEMKDPGNGVDEGGLRELSVVMTSFVRLSINKKLL